MAQPGTLSESPPRDPFERTIAALAARFIALGSDEIEAEIQGLLGLVAESFDLDRSAVALVRDGDLVLTHFWRRPELEAFTPVPGAALPWIASRIQRGEIVVLRNPEEIPVTAEVDRATVARHGQKAGVILPLRVAGEVLGAVTFVATREERDWTAGEIARFELVRDVVASAFARQRVERELRGALAENEALRKRLEAENAYLRTEIAESHGFEEIVGTSPAIRAVLHQVEQVAGTDVPVLILGETGTGKELVARAIHDRSPRSERALVAVNCAALPANLIESELFGHERGAFTGALQSRPGRFELADRGTLFLDEIGDLEPSLQAKLLRVLQDGLVQRVGAAQARRVDVRVVAATNRDLRRGLREERFRSDLYYRLSVFPIELPPLRERREDIPLLVWYFIQSRQRPLGRAVERVPAATMEALVRYDWPGNVRELQNVVERALILSPGPVLQLGGILGAGTIEGDGPPGPGATAHRSAAGETLAAAERAHVLAVLERCGWRIEGRGQAAERLGTKPSTLRHRMRKLGIRRPERI